MAAYATFTSETQFLLKEHDIKRGLRIVCEDLKIVERRPTQGYNGREHLVSIATLNEALERLYGVSVTDDRSSVLAHARPAGEQSKGLETIFH